jgi:thiol-disulfide isomerase/thioredoxin
MKQLVRNLVIALAVVLAIGAWQTRHLVARGELAPQLVGTILGGTTTYDLEAHRGKAVLVYFFAPWCGVCKVSAGNLEWLRGVFGTDSVEVVAVALDYETPEDVEAFVRDTDLGPVQTVLGSDAIRDQFKINAYPSYYVIDADGRVTAASVGYSTLLGMMIRVLFA